MDNEQEYTTEQIKKAIAEKRAVITWSHGNWENCGNLEIYKTPEEAAAHAEIDTRGKCYSMADETWAEIATDYKRALKANAGSLRYS